MIQDQDRSGWFGASDTALIMGNWKTETFRRWWLVKLGLRSETIKTIAMQTGTALEHRILSAIGVNKLDRQIRVWRWRLRVNLDGETKDAIQEVKTHNKPVFHVTKAYWMQAQVEMLAAGKRLEIVAYQVEPEDYRNWFRPIDRSRLSFHPVEYDPEWISRDYLPRLRYLARCMRKGAWPDENAL